MIAMILVVIITIFLPPLGVFLIAGCGADLLINIILTMFGYFPGHIHAFYLEYQYSKRKEIIRNGGVLHGNVPMVYSPKINSGAV